MKPNLSSSPAINRDTLARQILAGDISFEITWQQTAKTPARVFVGGSLWMVLKYAGVDLRDFVVERGQGGFVGTITTGLATFRGRGENLGACIRRLAARVVRTQ